MTERDLWRYRDAKRAYKVAMEKLKEYEATEILEEFASSYSEFDRNLLAKKLEDIAKTAQTPPQIEKRFENGYIPKHRIKKEKY